MDFSSCRTPPSCLQRAVCAAHAVDSRLLKSDIKKRGLMFVCYICLSVAPCLLFHLHFIYFDLNYFHVWSFEGYLGHPPRHHHHHHLVYPRSHAKLRAKRQNPLKHRDLLCSVAAQVTQTTAGRWMSVWLRHLKPVTSEGLFIWILLPAVSSTGFRSLLNCSNWSVNIMRKATETWNVALITTLIYQGQVLWAWGGWPFLLLPMISCLIWCTHSLNKCMCYIIYGITCLYKGKMYGGGQMGCWGLTLKTPNWTRYQRRFMWGSDMIHYTLRLMVSS